MTIQFGKLVRSVSPYTANYCSIYSHHSLTKSVTKVLKQKPESKIVTAIDAKGKTKNHTHTKFPQTTILPRAARPYRKY